MYKTLLIAGFFLCPKDYNSNFRDNFFIWSIISKCLRDISRYSPINSEPVIKCVKKNKPLPWVGEGKGGSGLSDNKPTLYI